MFDLTPAHSKFQSGPVGPAYNEAAFRHFLAVDKSRAQRLRRFLYMAMIAVRGREGQTPNLTDATAAAVFRGLGGSLREGDYVGWYKEGQVAGAVLAQGFHSAGNISGAIEERLLAALKKELTDDQLAGLRVWVERIGGRVDAA